MKIGDVYIRVSNMNEAVIVHTETKSLDKPGRVLLSLRGGGREWKTESELEDQFVKK